VVTKHLDQHNLIGRSINICRSHIGPLPKKAQHIKKILKFGFIQESNQRPWPLCVVCSDLLSNYAIKPLTLERHFQLKYKNLANKLFAIVKITFLSVTVIKTRYQSQLEISKSLRLQLLH
jgi:hypothetical protein